MGAFIIRISILWVLFTALFSQDTVRVFQYNLLFYGSGSTPINTKNSWLSTIINYVDPDIFGANEIGNDSTYSQTLLNDVLIANYGPASWAKGTYTNYSGANLTNMLFYKTANIGLKSEKVVTGFVRDMNIYNLYYHKPGYDTVFFTIAVVHLKAGNTSTNRTRRNNMATALMDTLNTLNPQYLIVMGDMNLYYSNEPAFQTFTTYTNPNIRLRDPINRVGNWHINSSFADVHTQCTRLNNIGDGGSSGGLDDRFDFILMNSAFFNSGATIEFIPGSYTTVGQDGNHFDVSLIDPPTNTSVPDTVLNALYRFSDHLPVFVDLKFTPPPIPLAYDNINLTLHEKNDGIILQWQNYSENTDKFIIEKAYSPDAFFQVATLNNTENLVMQFTDVKPKQGANYYRIKVVKKDGTYEYSNIKVYFYNSLNSITIKNIYPNPTEKLLNIPVITNSGAVVKWEVYNSLGQKVMNGKEIFRDNYNLFTLDVENLKSGIYLLKIKNKTIRFIKK